MENSALASCSSSHSRRFNPAIHPDFSKATSRFMQSYSLINPQQSSREPWWFTAGQSHVQFRVKITHLTGQAPSSGVALRRCLPVRRAFPHPCEGGGRVQTAILRDMDRNSSEAAAEALQGPHRKGDMFTPISFQRQLPSSCSPSLIKHFTPSSVCRRSFSC